MDARALHGEHGRSERVHNLFSLPPNLQQCRNPFHLAAAQQGKKESDSTAKEPGLMQDKEFPLEAESDTRTGS